MVVGGWQGGARGQGASTTTRKASRLDRSGDNSVTCIRNLQPSHEGGFKESQVNDASENHSFDCISSHNYGHQQDSQSVACPTPVNANRPSPTRTILLSKHTQVLDVTIENYASASIALTSPV